VVCWQGKVLAGITIEAIETASKFGPTTLARIIEHAEIADAAEKIVESQKLSGFLGFDFVLDHANRAWLLEMNPRVTPACHLRLKAPSLAAALFLQLTGEPPHSDTKEVPKERIALFPNRVSKKAALYPYFDDTPEEESAFLEACRRSRFLRRMFDRMKFRSPANRPFDEKITNIIRARRNK
jgi:predicted ATP-grasp superfamily ATP-dependent carboligase